MEMKMAGHFRERPKHHWELEIKSAAFIMDIMLSTRSSNFTSIMLHSPFFLYLCSFHKSVGVQSSLNILFSKSVDGVVIVCVCVRE